MTRFEHVSIGPRSMEMNRKTEELKGTNTQGQHKKYRSEQCKAEVDVPDSVHRPPLVPFPWKQYPHP